MQEDQEWVSQVLGGDKQAYAHLIRKYKNRVYALFLRMVQRPQDAQDLTQECFLKAYRYLHSYDTQRGFAPWLYRIAINLYVDSKTAKQRQQDLVAFDDETMPTDEANPETIYLMGENWEELQKQIDRLPQQYRLVLTLRYLEELTYQEISEILDISVATAQVRLHRAKQKLREYCQPVKKGGGLREMC
ncbi:sigma-70 family RNA polymerase sigma factor [Brevibacillus brevis]|uniref:Sigma-70 family RNA polymerase sigma factor n=1 Tax=Brevibacillus brevis TaxID=1393 RepID=A0ABY9TAZ4_BREBE|nr:sigma-70 family RNA polymerase sigma factor [Brevibacillus brevis]WNC16092.1 sigma-70 family RNA polymerase sigma factor [Brevibacillus brevis]